MEEGNLATIFANQDRLIIIEEEILPVSAEDCPGRFYYVVNIVTEEDASVTFPVTVFFKKFRHIRKITFPACLPVHGFQPYAILSGPVIRQKMIGMRRFSTDLITPELIRRCRRQWLDHGQGRLWNRQFTMPKNPAQLEILKGDVIHGKT